MSALSRLGIKTSGRNQTNSENQQQTDQAFGFKWAKRDTYESAAFKANMKNWLIEKYCSGQESKLGKWLEGGRKVILDAGCGAGFSGMIFFESYLKDHDYIGVDISSAASVARQRFAEAHLPGDFLQSDLMDLPFPDNSVDLIFSEGVLHHTDSTEKAIKYLTKKIVPGGKFLFYVYKKKAVIREFTDDHVRYALKDLSDEQAWDALKPLTSLGIKLGKIDAKIVVDEAIPFLGIEAGELDLQRFFYWNIFKAYYRPEFSFEEMHHINFDWFRPMNCHRHTPEEIAKWCDEAGLKIDHMNVQEAGITVVATKV